MSLIIAQGGGYYGSAAMTSPLGVDDIWKALKESGKFIVHPIGAPEGNRQFPAELAYLADKSDRTQILVSEWLGQPQPAPIVLFDTGHGDQDMEALKLVKSVLDKVDAPHVPLFVTLEKGDQLDVGLPSGMHLEVEVTADTISVVDYDGQVFLSEELREGKWERVSPPSLKDVDGNGVIDLLAHKYDPGPVYVLDMQVVDRQPTFTTVKVTCLFGDIPAVVKTEIREGRSTPTAEVVGLARRAHGFELTTEMIIDLHEAMDQKGTLVAEEMRRITEAK